jgi:acyl dehydratase
MVGSSTPLKAISWDERDTILYALGVGAGLGDPESELHFTTENTSGITLKAIPTMLTTLAVAAPPPALSTLDIGRFLHAEQSVEFLHPLSSQGQGFICNRIASIEDKGSGAIIRNAATLFADEYGQNILARSSSSIYVRGAGGFGGPRPTSTPFIIPDRAPDFSIQQHTRPEQALLYRLSGDRHRLHSDPQFARARDFPRPILHGLCTYGFACRAVMTALLGAEPERLTGMQARFVKPVFPGDSLTTQIWLTDTSNAVFQMLNSVGERVLERGTITLRSDY